MKVNEIFYSIQGEGRNTGRAAIFVRLAGCNLKCPFCDTDHQPYKELTEEEICAEIAKYTANLVVITGGEPTLQLTESLVNKIHDLGKWVAIETNGTRDVPIGVSWVTVSPKHPFLGIDAAKLRIGKADELKLVFDGKMTEETIEKYYTDFEAGYYYLQPCDTGDIRKNKEIINQLVEYVKSHTQWKISLQTHKMLNVR